VWRYISTILVFGVKWRYVVSFSPRLLYKPEINFFAYWTGCPVDARTVLKIVGKRYILLLPGKEPGLSARLRYPDFISLLEK
jgi:hypothetical protein